MVRLHASFGLALVVFCIAVAGKASKRPNIIFILADDLGWDDIGFHGSDQIPTPNIDALAYDGVILNNYYVQPICTPSRSALMTGRHPIHTGMQRGVIVTAEPYGLGLDEKLLPQYLKELDYATHIVGKWHLGFFSRPYTPLERGFDSHLGYNLGCGDYWDHTYSSGNGLWHLGYFNEEYVPTNRGYDTHLGYYQGCGDYWDHTYTTGPKIKAQWGLDFWNNTEVLKTCYGEYSTEVFTKRTQEIIAQHDTEKPLFMYLPHQAVHSGNPVTPLEAPWKYLKDLGHIDNKQRRLFGGMVSALDDSIGNITRALDARGMLENTIIAFSTDNGGPAGGFDMNMACNYPLRGLKSFLWEGGVRGAGFLWSPLLDNTGYVSNHMMQIFDWLPTLLSGAGYNMSSLPGNIDGMDFWRTLSTKRDHSPRTEMLHNIDRKQIALRVEEWKLIGGPEGYDGWYKPGQKAVNEGENLVREEPQDDVTVMEMARAKRGPEHLYKSSIAGVLKRMGRGGHVPHPVAVECGEKPANASSNCKPNQELCLFNIVKDPCEYNNVAHLHPDIVAALLDRLATYNATAVPPRNKPTDPEGYPSHHGGIWKPWINNTDVEV